MSTKDTQEVMDQIVETAKYVGGLEAKIKMLQEAAAKSSALEKLAQAVLDGRALVTTSQDSKGTVYTITVSVVI